MDLVQLEVLNWTRIWGQKFHRRVDSLVALPFLSFSQKVLFLLGPISPLGLVWEITVTLLSLIAIIFWIIEETDGYHWFPGNLWFFFACFLADLLLQFFRCTTYRAFGDFLFNITTIAELTNIVALAVGTNINFLRVFRLLATFDTYSGLAYQKPLSYISPLMLSIFRILYMFFCFWFSFASGFWMVEKVISVQNYGDCFYFITVTVSTAGYGDILPHTPLGKALITSFLFMVILGVPYNIGIILTLFSQKHSATTGTPLSSKCFPWGASRHAIICGRLSVENSAAFFRDFFHTHHGVRRSRLVLIPNTSPDPTLISMILRSPFYRNRVTYIEGSILTPTVLHQALLRDSFGVLVLPPESAEPQTPSKKGPTLASQIAAEAQLDDEVLLSMLALHYFQPTKRSYNILGPLNDHFHGDNSLPKDVPNLYPLPSLGSFRAMLIAQSCACPGFSTLLSNLLLCSGQLSSNRRGSPPWSIEYARGECNSIFTAIAPAPFWQKTWRFLVSSIWANFRVISIGILRRNEARVQVLLNISTSFRVLPGDVLLLIGFTIRDRPLIEAMQGQHEEESHISVEPSLFREPIEDASPPSNNHDTSSSSMDIPKFASSSLYIDNEEPRRSLDDPIRTPLRSLSTLPTAIDVLSSHIVIVMTSIDMLLIYRVIFQLLSIYHPPEILPPILIISPDPTNPADLAALQMSPHLSLFFLVGSLRETDTFRRASLEQARTVLLVTNWSAVESNGSDLPFVVMAINKYLGENGTTKIPVITEIRHTHEALFFRPLSSTLSNFTTDDLLSSRAIESSSDYESMLMYSSGSMLCSYPVHLTMLSQLLNDINLIHFMNALCLVRREVPAMVVRLIQLPAPLLARISDGHPLTFSQAFDWLFREMDVIPLGLKRSRRNFPGCPQSYVYTNPCIKLGPTRSGPFSFLSRIVLDEGTFRPLPRRLEPTADPILHPSDRLFILPCRELN